MKKTPLEKHFNIAVCRSCYSDDIVEILDLGDQVPANNLDDANGSVLRLVGKFPLKLFFCNKCKLVQLGYTVDPKTLFSKYLYVSSTSQVFRQHFHNLASLINSVFSPKDVLDIGSNDGVLLDPLKKLGVNAVGVDPAENLQRPDTINGFFDNPDILPKFQGKKFDVITACNVFAHISGIHKVIDNVRFLLKDNGVFIVEVVHVGSMLEHGYFDMVYHEHLFHYSLISIIELLRLHGLYVNDVEMVDTHGGSMRVFSSFNIGQSSRVQELLDKERAEGLDKVETYEKFKTTVAKVKDKNLALLNRLKAEGKSIAGYGAPAKATVLLNYYGITKQLVSIILEDNPMKVGKFIPDSGIEIVQTPDSFENFRFDVIYILAWNFAESIMVKCRERGFNGSFIVALPEAKFYE